MDVKASLSKKVGPLPAYAWVLILLGGIAAAKFLRAKDTPEDGISEDPMSGDPLYYGIPSHSGAGNGAEVPGGVVDTRDNGDLGLERYMILTEEIADARSDFRDELERGEEIERERLAGVEERLGAKIEATAKPAPPAATAAKKKPKPKKQPAPKAPPGRREKKPKPQATKARPKPKPKRPKPKPVTAKEAVKRAFPIPKRPVPRHAAPLVPKPKPKPKAKKGR